MQSGSKRNKQKKRRIQVLSRQYNHSHQDYKKDPMILTIKNSRYVFKVVERRRGAEFSTDTYIIILMEKWTKITSKA